MRSGGICRNVLMLMLWCSSFFLFLGVLGFFKGWAPVLLFLVLCVVGFQRPGFTAGKAQSEKNNIEAISLKQLG